MGATFLPAVASTLGAELTTRIPVGVSAYCASSACRDSNSVGSGGLRGVRRDGTAFGDFRLASAVGGTVCELTELQLRPSGRSAAQPHRLSMPALQSRATDVNMYAVEWAASAVTAASELLEGGSHNRPLGSWSMSDNWDGAIWRRGDAAAAASGQLRALQTQLTAASVAPLFLRTVGTPLAGAGPERLQSSNGVASAWAMWRVAAQEQPGTRLMAYGFDARAAAVPASLPPTDSFGMAVDAGTWLTPRLTTAHGTERAAGPAVPNGSELLASMSGTVLVTGGLGELGLLAGLWVAKSCAWAWVVLLGRSGRAAALAAANARTAHALIAVRCDVACSEELAAVMAELRERGLPPVQAVFHAGGVTQVGGPGKLA